MKRFVTATVLSAFLLSVAQPVQIVAAQVIAGTAEDKLFQKVMSEANPDAKLQLLLNFENSFPQSKVLADVYLMIIDVYRQKDNRSKIIEYGEKTLNADQNNLTAMMALSRNYALEGKNLDRAVLLGEQAVGLIEKMKSGFTPPRFTDAQWQSYLQETEAAARTILQYAKTIKAR